MLSTNEHPLAFYEPLNLLPPAPTTVAPPTPVIAQIDTMVIVLPFIIGVLFVLIVFAFFCTHSGLLRNFLWKLENPDNAEMAVDIIESLSDEEGANQNAHPLPV
uniref:Uncharacterized protein n=1 Tax=Caenorhabditis japonica TaxID=281687 RepID=A0A8R1IEG5_CAEJA